MKNRFILLFIFSLVFGLVVSGCASDGFSLETHNLITVTLAETGQEYTCAIETDNADKYGEAVCVAHVEKDGNIYDCKIAFRKTRKFSIKQDCEIRLHIDTDKKAGSANKTKTAALIAAKNRQHRQSD